MRTRPCWQERILAELLYAAADARRCPVELLGEIVRAVNSLPNRRPPFHPPGRIVPADSDPIIVGGLRPKRDR